MCNVFGQNGLKCQYRVYKPTDLLHAGEDKTAAYLDVKIILYKFGSIFFLVSMAPMPTIHHQVPKSVYFFFSSDNHSV